MFTENLAFGARSWIALAVWVAGLIGGMYLYQGWREANPVRLRFMRRLGLGLGILSAVGLVALALRAFGVPVLSYPIWSYLVMLATLGYLAWGVFYATQTLPALADAARSKPGAKTYGASGKGGAKTYGAGSKGGAKTYTAQTEPAAPRPVATTTRREARRDRKKKSR